MKTITLKFKDTVLRTKLLFNLIPVDCMNIVVSPKIAGLLQLHRWFQSNNDINEHPEVDSVHPIGTLAHPGRYDRIIVNRIIPSDGKEYMAHEDGTKIFEMTIQDVIPKISSEFIIEDGSLEKFDLPVVNDTYGQVSRITITDNKNLAISFSTKIIPEGDHNKLADALEEFVTMLRSKSIPDTELF